MNNILNSEIIKISGNKGININQFMLSASLAIKKILLELSGSHIINLVETRFFQSRKYVIFLVNFSQNPIYGFTNNKVNNLIGDISFLKENVYSLRLNWYSLGGKIQLKYRKV